MTDSEISALGKIPAIIDGKFFRIQKCANGKVTAMCLTCTKDYSGQMGISSNFVKHLKEKHHTLFAPYEAHKARKASPHAVSVPLPIATDDDAMNTASASTPTATIAPATSTAAAGSMFRKGWQKKADMLVTDMIVNNALPMRIVEMPEFQVLVKELSSMPQPVHCLSVKSVAKTIDERYSAMKAEIVHKLKLTSFVCTTADIWSSSRRSYLGVTVHWLNAELQRESYAIACTRFRGT